MEGAVLVQSKPMVVFRFDRDLPDMKLSTTLNEAHFE